MEEVLVVRKQLMLKEELHVRRVQKQTRRPQRISLRAERAEVEALDAPLDQLDDLAELLARAALMAAGFHQHKRGEWRRRRETAC